MLNLWKYFKRLHEDGMKLPPGKTRVSATHSNFAGHPISSVGVSPDSVKVVALTCVLAPANVKQLRSSKASWVGFTTPAHR